MFSRSDSSPAASPETAGAPDNSPMNTYQWLVILGFPPAIAAAKVMPELFTTDSTDNSTTWEQCARFAGLTSNDQE